MLPLELSNAFVQIMTQKRNTLRPAVCRRICMSHVGHFCAECVVAPVSFAQWEKKWQGPLSCFAKCRRNPLKGADVEADDDTIDTITKM